METLEKYECQLAGLQREFDQLNVEYQIRVMEDGYQETLIDFCRKKSHIHELKLKIADLKVNLKSEINSSSNMLKDKDPLECKKEEQFTRLKLKISSRQDSIVTMEERLARLESQSEYELRRSFRERHNLKLRIAEEQIYLQTDIRSNAKGVDNAPNEYKEQIGYQAAVIKDLEDKLAKLETETKSNNKILEKLAKLELESQSNKSLIEQQQKKTIKQLSDLKSLKEETSGNKASIEGLHLKLQAYRDKQEESDKLLDSFKTLLQERDDQIVLLELGSILDASKVKEKDDLLKEMKDRIANLN